MIERTVSTVWFLQLYILHPGKEPAIRMRRTISILRSDVIAFFELPQKFLLLFGNFCGYPDIDTHKLVAAATGIQLGDSFIPHAKDDPRLRARVDLQPG